MVKRVHELCVRVTCAQPPVLVGPVTQAIRAMRAAVPVKTETVSVLSESDVAIAAIREGVMRVLAERIERDIALLAAMGGEGGRA